MSDQKSAQSVHRCGGFLRCTECGGYLLPCTATASGIHPGYRGCNQPGHGVK